MSDDGDLAELDDRPHSSATDPNATTEAGDQPGNWYPARPRTADMCVSYCLTPCRRRRPHRCSCCGKPSSVRAIDGAEIEPAGTRFAWWAGHFLGGWAAAWRDATAGMIRKPSEE